MPIRSQRNVFSSQQHQPDSTKTCWEHNYSISATATLCLWSFDLVNSMIYWSWWSVDLRWMIDQSLVLHSSLMILFNLSNGDPMPVVSWRKAGVPVNPDGLDTDAARYYLMMMFLVMMILLLMLLTMIMMMFWCCWWW